MYIIIILKIYIFLFIFLFNNFPLTEISFLYFIRNIRGEGLNNLGEEKKADEVKFKDISRYSPEMKPQSNTYLIRKS